MTEITSSQLILYMCMKRHTCFSIDQTVVISASVGGILGILLMVMAAFILWTHWKMRQMKRQLKFIQEVCHCISK